MSWNDKALSLVRRCGPAAKFAAKVVLGAVLPGSPAIVELVGDALEQMLPVLLRLAGLADRLDEMKKVDLNATAVREELGAAQEAVQVYTEGRFDEAASTLRRLGQQRPDSAITRVAITAVQVAR